MLSLPILAQMSSAAIAAALTASITYGHYTVASGPEGAGLMPPRSVLHPVAGAGTMNPVAELAHALAALKLQEAKVARNKAMVDWLASLPADGAAPGFSVQRFDSGLVYAVRYAPDEGPGEREGQVLQDLVAVPFGPEMPFAISLKAGPEASVSLEGASCTARETLASVSAEAAEAEAMAQAEAYLAAPDAADASLPADCLMVLLKRR